MPFEQRTLFCVRRHKMSLQVMEPPTKEVLERVRSEFGLNEQRVRDAVEHLKDWIRLQPHLPKEIGTFWLRHCEQHHIVHNSRRVTGRGLKSSGTLRNLRCLLFIEVSEQSVDHKEHGAEN